MSKELFFATSFSGHVNYDTGEVDKDYRRYIESFLSPLREIGEFSVYCAVEAEGWKFSERPKGEAILDNYAKLRASNLVLCLVPNGLISQGLENEVGYAQGIEKPLVLATEVGQKLGFSHDEAIAAGLAKHVVYKNPVHLVGSLLAQI